ncbi:MAG: flotillin-like protein FloA [Clostridia bacterium]|nr:flotillin-like protein FloA [Clostridia bacterium]
MGLNLLGAISTEMIILFVALGIIAIIFMVIVSLVPMRTWFVALVSGSHVSMARLIGMKMRKVKVGPIITAYIQAKKAGLKIEIVDLETHYMAGGDIDKIIVALISAHSAKIPLTVEEAKAIDLAGRDVAKAVRGCVTPEIIETQWISAVAKNGIELKVKAKITLRSNISRLVRGAGEETILARVGEGIVTTVGSALTHTDVLENPDIISKQVLNKGLDVGTAYEILSIEMADIDVGTNIGAKLRIDDAEARKLISQANAEERRAMANAIEQEMKAKTQEMKAMVLAAEAEVPKAIATAIKSGQFGVMDYYKLQNLNSDTAMRNSIAGVDKKKNSGSRD